MNAAHKKLRTWLTRVTTPAQLQSIREGKADVDALIKGAPTKKERIVAAIKDVVAMILAPAKGDFELLKDDWRAVGKLSLALLDGEYMTINTYSGMLTSNRNQLRRYRKGDDVEFTFDKKQNTIGLNLTQAQDELIQTRKRDLVKFKNANRVIVEASAVEQMMKDLVDRKHKTIHHKIIACQLAVGARKIEILQPSISQFSLNPANNAEIIQVGVAKMLSRKEREKEQNLQDGKDDDPDSEVVPTRRTVKKHVFGMLPKQFLELLAETRAEIGEKHDLDTISNVQLGNNYNQPVNNAIKTLFDKHNMPEALDRKTHMLRKLWANITHALYAPKKQSLMSYLTEHLGHSTESISSAALHYSTIAIETGDVLTENTSATLLENQRRVHEAQQEIADLKKQVEEMKTGAPITREVCIETGKSRLTQSTDDKFALIDAAIASGNGTYTKLQKLGFSTYLISKYKKKRAQEAAEAAAAANVPAANLRPKKKTIKTAAPAPKPMKKRGKATPTVAQAGEWLLKDRGKAAFSDFYELGFSSKKIREEIRVWQASQGLVEGKPVD